MKTIKSLLAASVSLALVTACGSDFIDYPDEPINNAPIITVSDAEGLEKQTISISSQVEDEGTVTYLWSQNAGLPVSLQNTTTDTVSFVAPSVSEDKKISLNLKVTDSDGLASEKNVVVDIKQQLVNLSIEGIATDSPLIEADIKAVIGEQEFTSKTTSDGYYTLDLALDDDADMSQLVVLEAQGKDDQQAALLQSKLMSFASLLNRAGDDGILTSNEDFAVNITNFTTAKSALLARQNAYSGISTEQDLIRLMNELNAEELVQFATAIKVILDHSEGTAELGLPDGVENVFELALDSQKMSKFINLIKQRVEFKESRAEMLFDANVVDKTETSSFSAFYFNRNNFNFKPIIELDNNGTGYYSDELGRTSFQWSQNNGLYTLENTEGIINKSTVDFVTIGGEQVRVDVEKSTYKIELEVLSNDDNSALINVNRHVKTHYPKNELPDEENKNTLTTYAFTSNNRVDFSLHQTVDKLALPLPNNLKEETGISLFSATFILEPDGSGSIKELNNSPIQWQEVNISGTQSLFITLSDFDNKGYFFHQFGNTGGVFNIAVQSDFMDKNSSVGIGGGIEPNEEFNVEMVPGIYSNPDYSINKFWFELWPDGRLVVVSTSDYDENEQISSDEVSITKGNWFVRDGELTIIRNRGGDNCFYIEEGTNCGVSTRYIWNAFEQPDDSRYLTQKLIWPESYGIPDQIGIRKFTRFNERLSALPDNVLQEIGERAFVHLTGLIATSQYTNKVLHVASHDDWAEQFTGTILLNDDKQFSQTLFDEVLGGDYQSFADGQVILKTQDRIQTHNYGFLIESNNVVIGAYNGLPWPHFYDEANAKEYISKVATSTPVSTVEHLLNREIFMVDRDRDGKWVVSYLKFDADKITFFSDENFANSEGEQTYNTDDTGMISFPDDQNTLYLSLVTDGFNIIVTNDAERGDKDFNYFLFDHQKAQNFVDNINSLRASALR